MIITHRDGAPPLGDGATYREIVARLRQSDLFSDYQEAFEVTTGLTLALRGGCHELPAAGLPPLDVVCACMLGAHKSYSACLQALVGPNRGTSRGTETHRCLAGLNESSIPVHVGDHVIAYLQTGRVLFKPPTQRGYERLQAKIKQLRLLAPPNLRRAYFATRVVPIRRYAALLRLLGSFAQYLSVLSNELMMKQTTAEPVAVTKARAFLAANLGEVLSLGTVAQAVNISPFYFCKIFKSATGLTLSHYVSRARIAKTKELLLDSRMRVSEAAYASGFQSLSQFNRVFSQMEGQSPSAYRTGLHTRTARRLSALQTVAGSG
ncbi:MAG: helix-turn-helix domain-containing protein [Opitutus sp.]